MIKHFLGTMFDACRTFFALLRCVKAIGENHKSIWAGIDTQPASGTLFLVNFIDSKQRLFYCVLRTNLCTFSAFPATDDLITICCLFNANRCQFGTFYTKQVL